MLLMLLTGKILLAAIHAIIWHKQCLIACIITWHFVKSLAQTFANFPNILATRTNCKFSHELFCILDYLNTDLC